MILMSSTVIKDLDRPIDITGHVLSPFHQRKLNYQDCRFHYIAHLMCYRYAIVSGQRTFATGIRKWSRHLTDFPTPKFTTLDCVQQWHSILVDIYSHLCLTYTAIKSMLIDICPRANIINNILINVPVLAGADRLTQSAG